MKALLFGKPMGKNGKKGASLIVLYQKGLEGLAAQLSAMGYAMRAMDAQTAADAVIYTNDIHGALCCRGAARGAAVICVRGMDARQAAHRIERRGCKPLF